MHNPLTPKYIHSTSGLKADRIDAFSQHLRVFSKEKATAFLDKHINEASTCFAGITRQQPAIPPEFEWPELNESTVVALSGGLDSFLIVALIRQQTGKFPPVATLVSKLPGYCEAESTLELAEKIGLKEIIQIEVNEEDFIESLPRAIKAAEVPLYNLHPVSKWLFATRIKAYGFDACITGDGADQIQAHSSGIDYLPIVGAMFAAADVSLYCPFYTTNLIPAQPDHDKSMLREMSRGLLPNSLIHRPKHSCYTPALDLSRYLQTPEHVNDQAKTLAVTLHLLQQSY